MMHNERTMRFLGLTLVLVFLVSCSTQKNTRVSRWYHNMNAHYNVYFNANAAYMEAEKQFDALARMDYENCLPLFLVGARDTLPEALTLLKKAITKSYTTVQDHSITVKPKLQKGKLSPADKQFYARNEFCDYIDEAYLIIGKAHAFLLDEPNARAAFDYVTANFPNEPSLWEAQLWIALLAVKAEHYDQAALIFQKIEAQKQFPKQLSFLEYAVRAEAAVAQKDYVTALPFVTKALSEYEGSKMQKFRMMYLRAQLLQKTGDHSAAQTAYGKLLKIAEIPYEMQFNAQLSLAALTEARDVKLKKRLIKMSEDPRNAAYVDRIWTVLGKMEWQEGNREQAKMYYENALNEDNVAPEAKLKIHQELLNGYFKEHNYILAYPVLKKMLALMDANHPRYKVTETLYLKYKNLGESLEIIQRNDSILRIANMSEEYRNTWAKKLVEQYLKQQFDKERKEALQLEKKMQKVQENQFYFYNKKLLDQGKQEFEKKWGSRRSEDGWRRQDQRLSAYSDASKTKAQTTFSRDTSAQSKQLFPNQVDYYFKMLPQTAAEVASLKSALAQAYYVAGKAYFDELKEPKQGIVLWEKCLQTLPNESACEWMAYELARYYQDIQNTAKVEELKIFLQEKYPQSAATQQLCNPVFVTEMTLKYQKRQDVLDTVSHWYLTEQYERIKSQAPSLVSEVGEGEERRKIELMMAIAAGNSNLDEYKQALAGFVQKYGGTEEGDFAKDRLAFLNPDAEKKLPETVKIEKEPEFTLHNAPFYFVVILNQAAKVNQLKFNINVLNADRFRDAPMPNVYDKELKGDKRIVCCGTFATIEQARKYLNWVRSSSVNLLDKVGANEAEFVLITTRNLKILEQTSNTVKYIQFYRSQLQ